MVMDSDIILCRGYTLLYSKQYFCNHVYPNGNTQWRNGFVYQFTILTLDNKTSMEPFY